MGRPGGPQISTPAARTEGGRFLDRARLQSHRLGIGLPPEGQYARCTGRGSQRTRPTDLGFGHLPPELRAVPDSQGLLRNGYLAFGGSAKEAELIKCGVRLQPQRASIIQGSLERKETRSVSGAVDARRRRAWMWW